MHVSRSINHSLIIHDKFEDLLQQSHRCQDFFHNDKSAKEQATLVNAQNHWHKGTRQNKF